MLTPIRFIDIERNEIPLGTNTSILHKKCLLPLFLLEWESERERERS